MPDGANVICMGRGHINDANTLLLYRMNGETDPLATTSFTSTGDSRVWTYPEGKLRFEEFTPVPGEYARVFTKTAGEGRQLASGIPTTAQQNAMRSSHVHEMFVKVNDSGLNLFAGAVAVGETLATNQLSGFRITGGTVNFFWESGLGVNGGASVPLNADPLLQLTAGTWMHVAAVVDATLGQVRAYKNGVLIGTVAAGTLAAGGTSSPWLFAGDTGATNRCAATIRHYTISSGTGSVSWFLANAALMTTTGIMNTDANTVMDLKFIEKPIVSSNEGTLGSAMDLESYPLINEDSTSEPSGVGGLLQDGGYARLCSTGAVLRPIAGVHSTPVRDALASGNFTLELWMIIAGPREDLSHIGIWGHGIGITELQADNYCSLVCYDGARYLVWQQESGAGDTTNGQAATNVEMKPGVVQHVAVRSVSTGASTSDVSIFLDGVLIYTTTGLTKYNGGTNASLASTSRCFFKLGHAQSTTSTYMPAWVVDDVRFSDIGRTDAEILESYIRGVTHNVYRMRGKLIATGEYVYWSTTEIDSTGSTFPGGHPLEDVVVVSIS